MAQNAKSDQILSGVIAESAPRLNVMDLKIFRSPTALATPAVPLQHLTAKLAISLGRKPQTGSFGSNSRQGPT